LNKCIHGDTILSTCESTDIGNGPAAAHLLRAQGKKKKNVHFFRHPPTKLTTVVHGTDGELWAGAITQGKKGMGRQYQGEEGRRREVTKEGLRGEEAGGPG